MVNENVTIVDVCWELRHQGGLRPVWSNQQKCLLPDSALPARHSRFYIYTKIINALGMHRVRHSITSNVNVPNFREILPTVVNITMINISNDVCS